MKITFGIVAYNEEERIRRCLDSIAQVADEIILVHDGSCDDQTLAIGKEYTDKVFIRDRLGGSDPHRLYILEQASNEWVFMIDADEFLSEPLKAFLAQLSVPEQCGAIAFKWPLWNGNVQVTKTNYRPCLFHKKKCWAIGLHNFSIQTNEDIARYDYVLEHRPKTQKVQLGLLSGGLKSRIERDAARFALGYERLEKYNEACIPPSFISWFHAYTAHPLFYAPVNLLKYFLGSYRHIYKDGWYGFILSLQLGLYQYKLAFALWKIKRKK